MATGGPKEVGWNLVEVGTLRLENADLRPWYNSLVVLSAEMLIVVDFTVGNLRLYSLQDGKLLAISDKMQPGPWDVCLVNSTEVATILDNGQIEILAVKPSGHSVAITRVRTMDLKKGFDKCFGIKDLKFKEKFLVSGQKLDSMCWGIVSTKDEHISTIHEICKHGKYSESYLSTSPNDTMVYISCHAGHYPDNGVYGFDITTGRREFFYQHSDLKWPRGISVDGKGFIYVCNWNYPHCIHQLTEKGEAVTVHKGNMPSGLQAIYWEEQQGELFVTSWHSNEVRRLRPLYANKEDPAIPPEVLKMDKRSIEMYIKALRDGKEKVHNIRVMVVGQYGVGKTTLTKRLLGKDVKISERNITEGIDVHIQCCKVALENGEWITQEKNSEQDYRIQRFAMVLNESMRESVGGKIPQEEETPSSHKVPHVALKDKDTEVLYRSPEQDFDQNRPSTDNQQNESSSAVDKMKPTQSDIYTTARPETGVNITSKSHEMDPMRDMLQLLQENAGKLKEDAGKNSLLTVWDFAGQYAFYTTHQTFLTRRAIYLLVSDVSGQVTDLVDDECYFDSEGIMKCRVHDLIDVWLNSIHSCATCPEASIPPVILVGTHVDKISQSYPNEVCERYFKKIRTYLKDKPTRLHLVDEDFAIDNTLTVVDSKLDALKRKIVEVASHQPYWGEEIPARWLLLEQKLMKLKAAGVKVIPRSLVENLNQTGAVQISNDELDLFLRFQHDIGTILYFSMEILKEKIVLDPQWMIDALKSLITAEMFVLRSIPAVSDKWFEFKKNGKLSPELIDAVWTKEKNRDLHENKEHILLLMEQLNVIAKPKIYNEDALEIKEVNYFLAPCMLRQKTPKEVLCPKQDLQTESSSVLCYVFSDRFLPSPIFHRLLAACVAYWPLATKKKGKALENLIFCGCCVFQLDEYHKLTLHFRDYIIFMSVTRKGITNKTPSSKVCIGVREFVTANLVKIIGYLGESLKFEQCIQCPEYNGDSVNSLIPVSRLKEKAEIRCDFHDNILESYRLIKFWFEAVEERDVRHLLSDQGLSYVASRLGTEWNLVALDLDLTQAEIERIQMDRPGHTLAQINKALLTWFNRSNKSDHEKVEQLLNAIEVVKRNDLVWELKEMYHLED